MMDCQRSKDHGDQRSSFIFLFAKIQTVVVGWLWCYFSLAILVDGYGASLLFAYLCHQLRLERECEQVRDDNSINMHK